MSFPRPVRLAAVIAAAAILTASCSSSDDAEPASTTEATGAGAPGPLARYADYETVSYDDPEHWVCRPDVEDICDTDLDATVVEADGTLTPEPFEVNEEAPIDCFYVYPTISQDETTYSDWDASDDEEGYVTLNQAARLQSQCRLFAPVYRQRTLAGLGRALDDQATGSDTADPYADVADAFKTYMANDNDGRGIVLIGHSQGTGMLRQLMADEFDPNTDVRDLLVGAYLAGGAVPVPEGETVGGAFQNIELCADAETAGCVDSWASFRDTAPPPDGTFFGVLRGRNSDEAPEGQEAACVSPAAPGGGPADLDGYYPAVTGASILSSSGPEGDESTWVDPASGEITTPYVRVPGLVSGECTTSNGANVLLVTVNGDPEDPRADDIGGDLTPEWGLHLVDVNLVMGDIVARVGQQADAWAQD